MALTFLVDTSVLKRLARPAIRQVIEPLAVSGALARASVSDLEVGFPARNSEEWDRLIAALDSLELIETSAAHVRRALQVQRLLAQANQRGRKVPDLLIAAAAEERGLITLHYDADLDRVSAVTGQRSQWVVPAGSVEWGRSQVPLSSRCLISDVRLTSTVTEPCDEGAPCSTPPRGRRLAPSPTGPATRPAARPVPRARAAPTSSSTR